MTTAYVVGPEPSAHDESRPAVAITNTLGLRVDAFASREHLEMLLQRSRSFLVTFVNPASLAANRKNPALKAMLEEFDAVAPDGIGMSLAVRLLHGYRAFRISFDNSSLAPAVFEIAMKKKRSVALIGGQPGVAERARTQLQTVFPQLQIVAAMPGCGDLKEAKHTLKEIAPDIVVCGMGTGLQERFLLSLREIGWVGWGFSCGGFLDQLAQGFKYYPDWINVHHLRWAYRLYREPRRLWYRYSVEYSYFGGKLLQEIARRAFARVTFSQRFRSKEEEDARLHKPSRHMPV